MTEFTVLTVLHDSAAELGGLLDALERHLDPPPAVVAVDTDSRDGGADLAERRGARVVRLGANPGFGPANNAGLAHVDTEVTALLNPDVALRDAGLAVLAARARGREALLVPRLLNADGSPQRSAHPAPATTRAFLPALVPAPVLPRRARLGAQPWRAEAPPGHEAPRRVGWAIAAALAARTDLLRRLGPFDAAAFLHHEDLDLCLRAAKCGVPTELHPDVALDHAGGHSTSRHGEPLAAQAVRRREVILAELGRSALRKDDAAQALTFATRAAARAALGRDPRRPLAQLHALRTARRG